jgi:hypothetical protein
LFNIYQKQDHFYLEIPDSLLNRDILLVARISNSAPGMKVYAGDELNNSVIYFEKRSDKIFLRKKIFVDFRGDSTSPMYKALARSSSMAIAGSFQIECRVLNNSSIIDITDITTGDNELFSFNASKKKLSGITSVARERCYINSIKSYPKNVEIAVTKTFVTSKNFGPDNIISDIATFEINTSLLLLPSRLMQQRFQDDRVGYFSFSQTDYDLNPEGVQHRSYIRRWRLEPKPGDWDKYEKGELVEPQNQIIFYIDPATPKKWVPYLIAGVNDWGQAFEKAGFKNAIIAKEAPSSQQDPSWSLYDARHSAIVYKPSDIENAEGPNIADPRTGEILESHINWYHNVMQLIHDWYMVQCGPSDSTARKIYFSDSLMGTLIRFVCSHEVGHTLGLTHNMGASSTVPTDSLRSKRWVRINGFCPSIMDYARFNYVAQPEDSMDQSCLMPRIGVYDEWAIEWGYRLFPKYPTPESEAGWLNNWIIDKNKDLRLRFLSERTASDPRSQTEDLGNDAIRSSTYGIKNLQYIIPRLTKWTAVPNDGYEHLNEIYLSVRDQYLRYVNHVVCNIGGIYQDLHPIEQPGPIYSPVPKEHQYRALLFLKEQVFKAPLWLVDTSNLNKIGRIPIGEIEEIDEKIMLTLLDVRKIINIFSRTESAFGENNITLDYYLSFLKTNIWSELYTHRAINPYRQCLQKLYLREILNAYNFSKADIAFSLPMAGISKISSSQISSLLYGHILQLESEIKVGLGFQKDRNTIAHLKYLLAIIKTSTDKVTSIFQSATPW